MSFFNKAEKFVKKFRFTEKIFHWCRKPMDNITYFITDILKFPQIEAALPGELGCKGGNGRIISALTRPRASKAQIA